jgi:HEAT repeat protein
MVTFYCPNCWAEIGPASKSCPRCGFSLENFQDLPYEDKLLLALRHPILDNRMMAVQTLGNLGSRRALGEFERMLADPSSDVYLWIAILQAAAKIADPRSRQILQQASSHPSTTVRHAAQELLRRSEGR